jgi:hypothetical protein
MRNVPVMSHAIRAVVGQQRVVRMRCICPTTASIPSVVAPRGRGSSRVRPRDQHVECRHEHEHRAQREQHEYRRAHYCRACRTRPPTVSPGAPHRPLRASAARAIRVRDCAHKRSPMASQPAVGAHPWVLRAVSTVNVLVYGAVRVAAIPTSGKHRVKFTSAALWRPGSGVGGGVAGHRGAHGVIDRRAYPAPGRHRPSQVRAQARPKKR